MKFKGKRKLSELLVMVMIFTTLFTFGGIAGNVNTVSAADNYVSDMTWTSSTCGSPGYTVKKDLNVVGNPIVIQGVSYTKGIGNHAFNDNNVGADVAVNISGLGYTSFDA